MKTAVADAAATGEEPLADRHPHRQMKRMREAHHRLDVRDRFRLLTDLIDSQRKMIEVADHKARFALVIMGAANAALLLVVMRGHLVDGVPEGLRPWLLLVLLPYGAVAFMFLLNAARVLQPHMRNWTEVAGELRPPGAPEAPAAEMPLGLIYWGAPLHCDYHRYAMLWTEARVGQMSAELALLAHGLARVNDEQYQALKQLFRWLRPMLALAAVLIGALTVFAFL
jgi:hypothetical protein